MPLHQPFIDDALKLQADEAALERGRHTATSSTTPIKLLNDDAALEFFVCIIVALVAVVSCVCKTHIGCILVF